MVNNLRAIQESRDLSLGWKDLLEKGMVTHCSILAWRIPWTQETGQSRTRLRDSYWLLLLFDFAANSGKVVKTN